MLRRTVLTALLLLTSDTATSALVPAGLPSLTTDAAASAEVTLSDATTGEVLESLTIDDPVRARVYFSTQLAEGSPGDTTTYRVYPQLAEDSASDFSFDDAGYELDDNGEAVAGAYKLRAKVSARGELQVSITSEDRDWGPGTITGLWVADAEGGPGWLSLDGIRFTFRAGLDDLATGDMVVDATRDLANDVFEDHIIMRATLNRAADVFEDPIMLRAPLDEDDV